MSEWMYLDKRQRSIWVCYGLPVTGAADFIGLLTTLAAQHRPTTGWPMKFARDMIFPGALCAATFAIAFAMAVGAGVGGTKIVRSYATVAWFATQLSFVLWVGIPWLRGAERKHLGPFNAALELVKERWLIALLPLAIFPIFMAGFTVAKVSFPYYTGYRWDGFWTAADALTFGRDPWLITHALLGPEASRLLSVAYTMLWGAAFALILPLYCFSAKPQAAIRLYTAMMGSWFLTGVVGASFFSSAGPIFADLVDPALGQRFAPLRQSLTALLPANDAILISQEYLRRAHYVAIAPRGGGISAMPSMHLAVAMLFVIIAWNTRLRLLALGFWLVIWVGSIHFGYHYAWDGIVGSAIAALCWKATAPRARPLRAAAGGRLATA